MTEELKHHWRYDKILSFEEAGAKAQELRSQGKRIVTLNGSFDLLQAGHLDFIEEAKQQGDVLFVGVNSDKSVRGGKGPDRPIIPELERMALLAALEAVDYVALIDGAYNEEPQSTWIPTIKPDVHVNGGDYGSVEEWIEWPAMKEVGAVGYVVQRRPNLSTSEIIAKIKALDT